MVIGQIFGNGYGGTGKQIGPSEAWGAARWPGSSADRTADDDLHGGEDMTPCRRKKSMSDELAQNSVQGRSASATPASDGAHISDIEESASAGLRVGASRSFMTGNDRRAVQASAVAASMLKLHRLVMTRSTPARSAQLSVTQQPPGRQGPVRRSAPWGDGGGRWKPSSAYTRRRC
jgi:hypothetical protein